jgi:arsenate reductase (thioredoxin)
MDDAIFPNELNQTRSKLSLVLFVCLHGSAKSLVAMEHFNRLAAEEQLPLRAVSAGIEPDEAVPPEVVAGLAGDGFEVSGRTPQRVTSDSLARAAAVVSFGPDLAGLAPPGLAIEQWDDMPAVSDDYATARDAIRARVAMFIDSCKGAKRCQP